MQIFSEPKQMHSQHHLIKTINNKVRRSLCSCFNPSLYLLIVYSMPFHVSQYYKLIYYTTTRYGGSDNFPSLILEYKYMTSAMDEENMILRMYWSEYTGALIYVETPF